MVQIVPSEVGKYSEHSFSVNNDFGAVAQDFWAQNLDWLSPITHSHVFPLISYVQPALFVASEQSPLITHFKPLVVQFEL